MTYEQAMARLTEIVKLLEDGGNSLDDSVRLFEEGAKLAKFCNEKLANAEQKILTLDSVNGEEE